MSTQHNHMVIIKTTQRMASLGPVYRWEHRPGRLSNFSQGNSAGQQHNKDAIQTVWPQSLSPCAFHHLPLERKEAQMRERQWKALLQPGGHWWLCRLCSQSQQNLKLLPGLSQGTWTSTCHSNPDMEVTGPSVGNSNWQDCALTAGNGPPRGPSLCPLHQPRSSPLPSCQDPASHPPAPGCPWQAAPDPSWRMSFPSSEQLPGLAGVGRHLPGTTCHPARPGMPAVTR